MEAARGNLGLLPGMHFQAEPAPSPDNINWGGLKATWLRRSIRALAMVIPLAIIMIIPIGPIVGERCRPTWGLGWASMFRPSHRLGLLVMLWQC